MNLVFDNWLAVEIARNDVGIYKDKDWKAHKREFEKD